MATVEGADGAASRVSDLSFLTPYWTGREMMECHLESIRRFYPDAPVLISKRGGGHEEMEALRRTYGVEYEIEECSHPDAVLRLFSRCTTEYVCILDHDVVLLDSLDDFVRAIADDHYDLVGFEERVREPAAMIAAGVAPELNGWLRLAPGCTGVNFLVFNLRAFVARWGLRGVRGRHVPGARHYEYDYGIGQRLTRHHYVRPWHTAKYGMGNLLTDGERHVAWHQWYGAHSRRLTGDVLERGEEAGIEMRASFVESAEQRFLADFPDLDLTGLTPAWGPDLDAEADLAAAPAAGVSSALQLVRRVRRWPSYGLRGLAERVAMRLDRWRRLLR